MNTKLVAACLAGAVTGSAMILTQAISAPTFDDKAGKNCLQNGPTPIPDHNGTPPPTGNNVCCWVYSTGGMFDNETVRTYSSGKLRTSNAGEPPCAFGPP